MLDALDSRQVSAATRANYQQTLYRYLQWCVRDGTHPLLADLETLQDYTAELSLTLSRRTIATHQTALGIFYDEAVRQGVIHQSPMAGFRRTTAKHTFAPASLVPLAAIRAIRTGASTMGDRAAAVTDLIVLNGLEVAEITGATIDHLRTDGRSYWLTVSGRKGAARDLQLAPPVVEPLLRHVGDRLSGPLLVGQDEQSAINRHAITRIVKSAARRGRTNVKVNPRVLRNTFISIALSQAPIDAVRDYIGIQDVRGFDRLLANRGSAQDVPLRVTQTIVGDVESGLLQQARRLLDMDTPVHVAAPVVLIGAALEEHLRAIVEREALSFSGTGSIMAYANALRTAGLIDIDNLSKIDSWSRLRNHAAHGDLKKVTVEGAEAMLSGVRALIVQVA